MFVLCLPNNLICFVADGQLADQGTRVPARPAYLCVRTVDATAVQVVLTLGFAVEHFVSRGQKSPTSDDAMVLWF